MNKYFPKILSTTYFSDLILAKYFFDIYSTPCATSASIYYYVYVFVPTSCFLFQQASHIQYDTHKRNHDIKILH